MPRTMPTILAVFVPLLLAQREPGVGQVTNKPAHSIPYVGCPADGQLGPQSPLHQATKTVHLPAKLALEVAWYQGKYAQGVIAPRGWKCFVTYGSNGSTVYVSPEQLSGKLLFSGKWRGFTGPAVQLSVMSGSTSGRFSVASTIGLVFPAYRAFAQAVVDEHLLLDKLSDGPFKADTLRYRNDHVVEFVTPPQTKGLGTESFLVQNQDPIYGAEILTNADTDLVSVAIRLHAKDPTLAPAIIEQIERANRVPPPKP